MNLQQFRFVQEAARRELNLTETAKALHTSQPAISKAILELEEELGIDIFARHGKRLRRITEPGRLVLKSVDSILQEVANLQRIGEQYSKQDAGTLRIAATHTQARYFLPEPIAQLRRIWPKVQVALHQGTPQQVARMLLDDMADVGLATEELAEHEGLITLPCHEWQHVMLVPAEHALAQMCTQAQKPTLQDLAAYPLLTYQAGVAGRSRIDQAFERAGLKPQLALQAADSDVIKAYVREGLGVGIVADLALRGGADTDLACQPLGYLFGSNTTRLAFKRGTYVRRFVLAFAEGLSSHLNAALVQRVLAGAVYPAASNDPI